MIQRNIVSDFFTGTGSTYDLIVNLSTYGADRYWKSRILQRVPSSHEILDLACGTGILTFKLAEQNPGCRIVGVDTMEEYIRIAQRKSKARRHNIEFICGRAEEVVLNRSFDCVTSSYIPKYVPAARLLENISPNLKTDGRIVLHDFTYPSSLIYRKLWEAHMGLLKYVGTPLFPRWQTVFHELADLVRGTKWVTEYGDALRSFGYTNIRLAKYTAGSAAVISARKA